MICLGRRGRSLACTAKVPPRADRDPWLEAGPPPGRRQRAGGSFVGGCWETGRYACLAVRTVNDQAGGPRRGELVHDLVARAWSGFGENFSGSGQSVLELMNRVGADGWELADLEERREGDDGRTYWDAA